jgi:hypothetical protein
MREGTSRIVTSLSPHGTIRLPLEELSFNLILEDLKKNAKKIRLKNIKRIIVVFV